MKKPKTKKEKYEYIKSKGLYRKRLKDVDGVYVALYGRTIEELERKIEIFLRQTRSIKFRIENPTVEEYAKTWLSLQGNIQVSTQKDYELIIKKFIVDVIGDKYICQVKPDDVALCMSIVASKKSRSVCRKTGMLLKRIFKAAYINKLIRENPCFDLETKGGTQTKKKVPLTDQQVDILLEATKDHRVGTFIAIGLYAGLRREEILGLKWENVDLESDYPLIKVKLAWRIVFDKDEHKYKVEISERLKNSSSEREVPIPKCLVEILKKSKEKYPSEYVVPNRDGGPLNRTQWDQLWEYVKKRTVKKRVYYRMNKYGVKEKHEVEPKLGEFAPHNKTCKYVIDFYVTPHILRHTYITNLLEKGVDVKTVQHLAGHKTSEITMDIYAHLKYNTIEEISPKVNKAFEVTD